MLLLVVVSVHITSVGVVLSMAYVRFLKREHLSDWNIYTYIYTQTNETVSSLNVYKQSLVAIDKDTLKIYPASNIHYS